MKGFNSRRSPVLQVPTSLLQKRVVSSPRLILPSCPNFDTPSPEQTAAVFGKHWEAEVVFVWRTLTAMCVASPGQSDPQSVASLARECEPMVGPSADNSPSSQKQFRWLQLAPFVHPTSKLRRPDSGTSSSGVVGTIPPAVLRSFSMNPLMRFGDAAISLTISTAAITTMGRRHQQNNNNDNPILLLRDAAFIASIVRDHGWSELMQYENKQQNKNDLLQTGSAGPNLQRAADEVCVGAFVAVIGAVYVQRGIDVAANVTVRLAETATRQNN